MNDERPASPPSRAVRMTRRQLAKVEQLASQAQPTPAFLPEPIPQETREVLPPTEQEPKETEAECSAEQEQLQAPRPIDRIPEISSPHKKTSEEVQNSDIPEVQAQPAPEIVSPEVEESKDLEPKTLASDKPCEEELAPTPKRAPSRSPARSPMRLEESIEAIDALEEALEQVGKAIPQLDPEPDRSPRKARFDARATPNTRSKASKPETAKKTAPISSLRLSRNPSAPKSAKPTSNAVNNVKTRDQSGTRPSISRSTSTRLASSSKESELKSRTTSGATETKDYLASKRRPISLSFPAPPAPIRSSKPPTKPTFQLPGDAIAAKLKAQREERQKREEERKKQQEEQQKQEPPKEAAKKPAFKARPAPVRKSSAPVRQTAASKARENLLRGEKQSGDDSKADAVGITSGTASRSSSLSSALSKRQSTVLAPPPTATRPSFQSSVSGSSLTNNRVNASTKPAVGGPMPAAAKSTVSAADVATQRVKAREIFNRDKLEKEQREQERREKEEAAKRARAEAAERGRIASREWAEKQRLKRMGMTAGGASAPVAAAAAPKVAAPTPTPMQTGTGAAAAQTPAAAA